MLQGSKVREPLTPTAATRMTTRILADIAARIFTETRKTSDVEGGKAVPWSGRNESWLGVPTSDDLASDCALLLPLLRLPIKTDYKLLC